MSNQPNPEPRRLDQNLTEETQTLLKGLLDRFPDLRTVAIVFDYHLDDAGSLPVGTWLPSRNLKTNEVLSMCRAVDKVGYSIRHQHDTAAAQHIREAEQRAARAEQHANELAEELKQTTQIAEEQRNGAERGAE